jgi:hypothetical protein
VVSALLSSNKIGDNLLDLGRIRQKPECGNVLFGVTCRLYHGQRLLHLVLAVFWNEKS